MINKTEMTNFVDILEHHATSTPNTALFTFLSDNCKEDAILTCSSLQQKAMSIATLLQQKNISGKNALLLYEPGLEFISALFGCMYGSVSAVPGYPPDPYNIERSLIRLELMVQDSDAQIILTSSSIIRALKLLGHREKITSTLQKLPFLNKIFSSTSNIISQLNKLEWVATDKLDLSLASSYEKNTILPNETAFLQYTSGSTNHPKGVIISHENIMHNQWVTEMAYESSKNDSIIGWLPTYHDMGLVGGIFHTVYHGMSSYLMSPITFLKKPLNWLQAVSKYKCTMTASPNFGFDLCVHKISNEEKRDLDLSSWRCVVNGAEPVRQDTMDRFVKAFKSCGFRYEYFYPCYGLAESTLLVSSKKKPQATTLNVDKTALKKNKIVIANNPQDAIALVGCGCPIRDGKIVIINSQNEECQEDVVGEVWLASGSVASGYWNKVDESKTTFHNYLENYSERFMRTGDLGFLHQGELFVTGRLKDLIISRGRNIYPHDVEREVEVSHKALRLGCNAAFSIESEGHEKIIVVQEMKEKKIWHNNDTYNIIFQTMRKNVAQNLQVEIDAIILIKARTIPKTSSGKIQRNSCKSKYLENKLEILSSYTKNASSYNPAETLRNLEEFISQSQELYNFCHVQNKAETNEKLEKQGFFHLLVQTNPEFPNDLVAFYKLITKISINNPTLAHVIATENLTNYTNENFLQQPLSYQYIGNTAIILGILKHLFTLNQEHNTLLKLQTTEWAFSIGTLENWLFVLSSILQKSGKIPSSIATIGYYFAHQCLSTMILFVHSNKYSDNIVSLLVDWDFRQRDIVIALGKATLETDEIKDFVNYEFRSSQIAEVMITVCENVCDRANEIHCTTTEKNEYAYEILQNTIVYSVLEAAFNNSNITNLNPFHQKCQTWINNLVECESDRVLQNTAIETVIDDANTELWNRYCFHIKRVNKNQKAENPVPTKTSQNQNIQQIMICFISETTGIAQSEIDVNLPISEWGLDSMNRIELLKKIEIHIGKTIDIETIWKYPTIASLNEYLVSEIEK